MGTSARDDAAAEAVALLERRLARCTLFAEKDPHIQTFPATSNPGGSQAVTCGLASGGTEATPTSGVDPSSGRPLIWTGAGVDPARNTCYGWLYGQSTSLHLNPAGAFGMYGLGLTLTLQMVIGPR